jgi:formylglycine-generating enzyme required for sulfatase activity
MHQNTGGTGMNMKRTLGAIGLAVLSTVLPSCGRAEKPAADGNAAAGRQKATAKLSSDGKELVVDLGNNVTMKLVLIPAGKFTMGSPKEEKGRSDDEGPQREVTIGKPFHMGVSLVTQAQYEQVMGGNPSYFEGKTNPVEKVSWYEANEFCETLSKGLGKTVRLPTEAEWEYACRAGSKTRFGFGDDDGKLGDYAWSAANSDGNTHPVGLKKPNAWGLCDMHGNVWQWCGDWYDDRYDANSPAGAAGADKTGPRDPTSGNCRVVRGGSWSFDPWNCRSAGRTGCFPAVRAANLGFRVVAAGWAGPE